MGLRSPRTEKIHTDFHAGKAREKERTQALRLRMEEQVRFNRAALIGRVPAVVVRLLEKLRQTGFGTHNRVVIGTNALYAYESMAGVLFEEAITATTDVNLRWDTRSLLNLVSQDPPSLLGILQAIDSSFERLPNTRYIRWRPERPGRHKNLEPEMAAECAKNHATSDRGKRRDDADACTRSACFFSIQALAGSQSGTQSSQEAARSCPGHCAVGRYRRISASVPARHQGAENVSTRSCRRRHRTTHLTTRAAESSRPQPLPPPSRSTPPHRLRSVPAQAPA